jgi:hypothetical protein
MRRLAPAGLVLAAGVAAGCRHPAPKPEPHCTPVVDRCADIPEGAIPAPPGTHSGATFGRQADRAEHDDFVVYYHEWLDGTAALGPFGAVHLPAVIARGPSAARPVVLQPEPDRPHLTAERQRVLVEVLAAAGVPDPAAAVLVAQPAAEGLYGREAERIEPLLVRGGGGANRGLFGALGGFGNLGGLGIGGYGNLGGLGGGFGGIGGFGF